MLDLEKRCREIIKVADDAEQYHIDAMLKIGLLVLELQEERKYVDVQSAESEVSQTLKAMGAPRSDSDYVEACRMIKCYDQRHAKTGKVYLAGPIKGCADAEIFRWRKMAAAVLDAPTLDPAAARNFVHKQSGDPLNEIVNPNKHDIDASAIVLANCWQVSVGTSQEILYAWERGKYVVVVIPEREQPASAWIIAHAHVVFTDLLAAIDHINRRKA